MTDQIFSMSFTSGTLLYHESIIIANLYADLGDWDAVRDVVVGENRLQMRTLNASQRIFQEVSSRLRLLTGPESDLLRAGTRAEQNYLLWLGICKRYRFIYDFAVGSLHERFLQLDMVLGYEEYDVFFNRMAEWHPEVERVAASTRRKQRQVVFKMMREADLLSDDGRIQAAIFSPRLIETIQADDPGHFAIFPIAEHDLKARTG